AGDDAELEIAIAGDGEALHDLRPLADQLLELLDVRPGVLLQSDGDQRGDAEAERLGIEEGAVAAYGADLLQTLQAPGALGGGEGDDLGQSDIGHAAVALEGGQDPAVELVQISHASISHAFDHARNFPA